MVMAMMNNELFALRKCDFLMNERLAWNSIVAIEALINTTNGCYIPIHVF